MWHENHRYSINDMKRLHGGRGERGERGERGNVQRDDESVRGVSFCEMATNNVHQRVYRQWDRP